MSGAPAYHARTHMPGGTDPLPFGGWGPWLDLDLENSYTGTLQYRHAPGSPGGSGDDWMLKWRGHVVGASGVFCGTLPTEDRPPTTFDDERDDKYGVMEGEDESGSGIVAEWYVEAATGRVFITFPITTSGGGGGGSGRFDAFAYIREEQTAGTNGGTFTSGAWRTRTLNTEVEDATGIVSISSNQFTLAAGKYLIKARAPAFECGRHKLRLRDITNSADVGHGPPAETNNASEQLVTEAHLTAVITPASSTAYELQHQCQTTKATFGLGLAANFGVIEVYGEVEIYRYA